MACDTTLFIMMRAGLSLVPLVVWTLGMAGAVWFGFLSLVNVNSKVGDSHPLRRSNALWWRGVDGADLQVES